MTYHRFLLRVLLSTLSATISSVAKVLSLKRNPLILNPQAQETEGKIQMRTSNFFQTIVAVLLAVVLATVFTTDLLAEAFSLEEPSLSSAKRVSTQDAESTFPKNEAGMSAYVKVDQTIDIEDIVSNKIFSVVEDVGENYILGIVPINEYGGTIYVHLYAHTEGWLVAYFERDEVAAKIMRWYPANRYKPRISTISSTTLSDVLHQASNASGILTLPKIKYYHFGYPDATDMILLVKEGGTMQIKVPEDYVIYEASWYHILSGVNDDSYGQVHFTSGLRVDETEISLLKFDCGLKQSYTSRDFGTLGESFTSGTLHAIFVYCNFSGGYGISTGGAGIATVLIYKGEE